MGKVISMLFNAKIQNPHNSYYRVVRVHNHADIDMVSIWLEAVGYAHLHWER